MVYVQTDRPMYMTHYDYYNIEKKWQDRWYNEHICDAKKKTNKKFFIHFAYPGVSGYLHVGHMRGFTYCDIIARYKRMNGYDVLYPAGFHASGIPSIGFAKRIERNDPVLLSTLHEYGCDNETIEKLRDPSQVVEYFSEIYVNDYWKRFGFLIDYTRTMSTISEGYKRFIQWQFKKLYQHNLLIQKPHFAPFCPKCGPVAVDKSETDISKGGNAEILDFTVIKFSLEDGTILPAATLRPETIFGVTNMWVNPTVEYVKIKIKDETWIISQQGAQKLIHQLDDLELLDETVTGKDLLGKMCEIPSVRRKVPILSGTFADPNVGTGIVMSVPAHAPYDYIALVETKEPIEPITIIDVKDLGENPARKVCEELHITSQQQTKELDEATDIVYKKEFHTGILNDKCGPYAGIKISEIKDEVKNILIQANDAVQMKEFSEEVICRCSEEVIIKQIPDQWFIKYSDKTLTEQTKEHVQQMTIFPEEYKQELPGILDWFDDRACIRKGSWLGTEFPYKKGWIIEPISDSTLYPAYYLISRYVNNNDIDPIDMTEEFFDYVFLGKGDPLQHIWKKIRDDVLYWYPVDINLGGKEHKTVHFPVFLMNHVAIMPESGRPRGIFVHWWVTQKGKEKISKSKGGAEHITEAAKIYGIDAMRLYYAHVGSPFVDIEWDKDSVYKYKNKILNIHTFLNNLLSLDEPAYQHMDTWIQSRIQHHIYIIQTNLNSYNLRVAANQIFFELQKDIQWYVKRGGGNRQILTDIVETIICLMTPFTPHLAEELWQQDHSLFVSDQTYPRYNENACSDSADTKEYLLQTLLTDIQEILKVTGIAPKKLCLYTSAQWKQHFYKKAIDLEEHHALSVGDLMKEAMNDPFLRSISKEVSKIAGKLTSDIKKLNETDKKRYQIAIDERGFLSDEKRYLEKTFSCTVEIYRSDDENLYDPQGKARFAEPLRPAIYIE